MLDAKSICLTNGTFTDDNHHLYLYNNSKDEMIVHLSNHFDLVLKPYKISEAYCPETGVYEGLSGQLTDTQVTNILQRRKDVWSPLLLIAHIFSSTMKQYMIKLRGPFDHMLCVLCCKISKVTLQIKTWLC